MEDLKGRFEQAVSAAQSLSRRPSTDSLLKLYALYKQATTGDVTGQRPGMMDMKGRAKYDAWSEVKGVSSAQAMERYVALVDRLKGS